MAAKFGLMTSFRDRTHATTPPPAAQDLRNRVHIRDDPLGGVLVIAPHGCLIEIDYHECRPSGLDGLEGVHPSASRHNLADDLVRDAARVWFSQTHGVSLP